MKHNIDLTEDRIFSRNNSDIFRAFIQQVRDKYNRYPWRNSMDEINSEDDLGHQKESLIALGNKVKRAEIRGYREMDDPNYCMRCGIRMNLHPWDKEIDVCHKCNEILQSDNDKCLWRIREEIIEMQL